MSHIVPRNHTLCPTFVRVHTGLHTHLLTAESLWRGGQLWWGVLYLTHRHIYVTCIILSLACKFKHNYFMHSEERTHESVLVPVLQTCTTAISRVHSCNYDPHLQSLTPEMLCMHQIKWIHSVFLVLPSGHLV